MSKRLIGPAAILLIATVLVVSCSAPSASNPGGGGSSNVGGGAGFGGTAATSGNSGSGGSAATGGGQQCPAGMAPCNGVCVNSTTDPNNCGACGNICGGTQSCANGVCTCPPGTLACGTLCVNSASDVMNCGGCGVMCGPGQTCTGSCTCSAGLTACPSGCTNTMADGANCGACGMACPAGQLCSSGGCVASCPSPQVQCGTGCVDPATYQTDVLNCGACGNACPAGTECNGGICGCPAGQMDCNGTCKDVMGTDVNNCGGCGMTCSSGQACNAGVCGCGDGQTDCSGTCRDTQNDNANCGGCGMACPAGQTCSDGTCSGGSRPGNCPATADVISDFEEGTGVMVQHQGRSGYWYVFADPTSGSQTPAFQDGAPIDAAPLTPAEGECNRYAMHSTSQNHPQYVGFGGTFLPGATAADKQPYNVGSAGGGNYTGISFRIRSEGGNAPPIWFEFLNEETQPGPNCPDCGSGDLGGSATDPGVDAFNTRGRLISNITTSWQTVTLPFATLAPRYIPSACANPNVLCEAPPFNTASALGFQFSLYDQFNTSGAYNLWVDDVKLTTGDAGIPTHTQTGNNPFPRNAALGNGCIKPTGADGKHIIEAFNLWKQTFVTSAGNGLRVRFDNANETVSEGIAYGMLIAVYMGDKALFDGLWNYWKAHPSEQSLLMHWKIHENGSVIGQNSATDADEDAAFALIQAAEQWGGSYLSEAQQMLAQIRANDLVLSNGKYYLRPGNSFGGTDITNPSYFAPAFYRVFAQVDSANAAVWNSVIATTYEQLNKIEGGNGLVPAWCSNTCGDPGGGGFQYSDKYQYDSHRTPWRIGLDACWNNNADAKDYVNKVATFFVAQVDQEGFGMLWDLYETSGSPCGSSSCGQPAAKRNSMSMIGTAAFGVAASNNSGRQSFVDRAWRFLLDANYTADPTFRTGSTSAYTYYNATVGLLMALSLSGNFNNF